MKKEFVICLFIALLAVFGCETRHKGPIERAGERTDEIIDNVKDGQNPLHKKGTLEKAGEAIDDAVDPDKRRR
jgi:hypothetical protein